MYLLTSVSIFLFPWVLYLMLMGLLHITTQISMGPHTLEFGSKEPTIGQEGRPIG